MYDFKTLVKCYFTVPAAVGFKICGKCSHIKPMTQYYKNKITARTICKSCLAAYARRYAVDNADKVKISQNARCSTAKHKQKAAAYYLANREERIAYQLEHAKRNPGMYNAQSMKYHATKLQRTPQWLSKAQLTEIKRIYDKAAYLTRKYGYKWI